MKKEHIINCERKRMQKWLNFRLPYRFLKLGGGIAIIAIIVMFFRAFAMEGDTEWLKEITKKVLLVGLLMMSVSKDREEDEMTIALRMQSYALAFVVGVVYALVMPYIEYGVSNVVHGGGEAYKNLGDFQVLLFMLMIQLLFYHNLKRYR